MSKSSCLSCATVARLQRGSAPLQRDSATLQYGFAPPTMSFCIPCNVVLRPCNVVLHPLQRGSATLQCGSASLATWFCIPCNVVLRPCNVVLRPCNVVLRPLPRSSARPQRSSECPEVILRIPTTACVPTSHRIAIHGASTRADTSVGPTHRSAPTSCSSPASRADTSVGPNIVLIVGIRAGTSVGPYIVLIAGIAGRHIGRPLHRAHRRQQGIWRHPTIGAQQRVCPRGIRPHGLCIHRRTVICACISAFVTVTCSQSATLATTVTRVYRSGAVSNTPGCRPVAVQPCANNRCCALTYQWSEPLRRGTTKVHSPTRHAMPSNRIVSSTSKRGIAG
jgi:hypothetical protein